MQGGIDGRLGRNAGVDWKRRISTLCIEATAGTTMPQGLLVARDSIAVDHNQNHTFGEQAAVARLGIPPQEPAVAKVVVALDQLHAVAAGQRELVGAARLELVCTREVSLISLLRCRLGVGRRAASCELRAASIQGGPQRQGTRLHLRTTKSTSPHRAASVCDLAAMRAKREAGTSGNKRGWVVVGGDRDNHERARARVGIHTMMQLQRSWRWSSRRRKRGGRWGNGHDVT